MQLQRVSGLHGHMGAKVHLPYQLYSDQPMQCVTVASIMLVQRVPASNCKYAERGGSCLGQSFQVCPVHVFTGPLHTICAE